MNKVYICPRINGKKYSVLYTETMTKFAGKVASVKRQYFDVDNVYFDTDAGGYIWPKEALIPLDKPVSYTSLDPGSIIVFNIAGEYKTGEVIKSRIGNYYIKPSFDLESGFLVLCGLTILEFNQKYLKKSRNVLIAESYAELEKQLDLINSLAINKENINPLKQENYVVKLQRTKALIRGAKIPEGNRVCSKITKTAISIECLSHSVCSR